MTLGYSTHWPESMGPEHAGKPNHFVEKIWEGLLREDYFKNEDKFFLEYIEKYEKQFGQLWDQLPKRSRLDSGKLHTFRKDSEDRWKVGMNIHPVINNRTKNRFQFAPVIQVKSIQKIQIEWSGLSVKIFIDESLNCGASFYPSGKLKTAWCDIEEIAKNDGFDSVEQFFAWFNTDFTGKIIHWTDLRY